MEARRKLVGAPALTYLFPGNGGVDNATATALVAAGVAPEAIAPDCHATDGPSCELAAFRRLPWFNQSAITCEVNGRTSDLARAMAEGKDLSRWFNAPAEDVPRLLGRMTSFVTMRSGHFEHSIYYQGISYFLPNMSWIMPPGYVHVMVSQTWAPHALLATLSGGDAAAEALLSASAQLSEDRARLVVQLTNAGNTSVGTELTIGLSGGGWAPSGSVGVWTLAEPVAPGVAPNAHLQQLGGQPYTLSPPKFHSKHPPCSAKFLSLDTPPAAPSFLARTFPFLLFFHGKGECGLNTGFHLVIA